MKRGVGLVAIALVGVLAGCSGTGSTPASVETVELSASSMAFGTKELDLENGKAYRLVLNNQDSVEHDFSVTKIPVNVHEEGHGRGHASGSSNADLHVHAAAGKSEAVVFTPTKDGTYEFFCTVPGHKEGGMVGTLVVK